MDAKKTGILVAALTCGLLGATPAAHAGFEWNAPPVTPAMNNEGPAVPAAPAIPVESVTLMPGEGAAPALNTNPLQRPMPDYPNEETNRFGGGIDTVGSMNGPADMPRSSVPHRARPPSAMMKAQDSTVAGTPLSPLPVYPEAVGFGRDIPLALAMQQIVPAGYGYKFDNGVNPGVRVNWNGGKPWNQVLQDAVAAAGLNSAVHGTTVWVGYGQPEHMSMAPQAAPQDVTMESPSMESAPMAEPAMMAAPASQPTAPSVPVITAAAPLYAPAPADDGYHPSYPRRDPNTARERMMQEQAAVATQQEPAGYAPDDNSVSAPSVAETQRAAMPAQDAAPMPLVVSEESAGDRNYVQLTGMNGQAHALDQTEIRYWQARPGESLKDVLRNWSEQAGVELFWAEGMEYTLPQAVQMHGTFQDAVTQVLKIYDGRPMQPLGQLHPNQPTGPAVLIIDHMS